MGVVDTFRPYFVKSALLMTCPYLLADVSLADAAMPWLTSHVASARYRNISQRGIIRKKVDDSSFLNGIHIFFLHSLGNLSGLFHSPNKSGADCF